MEGLQQYKDNQDIVQVVVTDSAMPEMNGAEMVQRIRAMAPGVKFIIASGTAVHDSPESESAGTAWLQKPYSVAELKDAIRRVCR
jgi:CheY-like chemotaxis protein